MLPIDPFNIGILNIDHYIKSKGLIEVKSPLIWEASSTSLHPDGLFSEGIFGQIGTPERIVRIGFISLHTKILAPLVYKNVIDLKGIYSDIMEGKTYATFDKSTGEFIPCDKTTIGCDTGYNFFITHFPDLKFAATKSHTRTNKIKVVESAKKDNSAIIERMLVLPAGLRDLKQEGEKFVVEEINKLYTSILSLASEVNDSIQNPFLMKVYDGVKYNLQKKVYEVYDYHKEFFSGKTGFGQRRFARRAVAHGTRNVISGAILQGEHPDDPKYLKHTETLIPLFQCVKMFQPLIIYHLRSMFYSQIFSNGVLQVAAISPKTKMVEYVSVTDGEVNRALTSESLEDLINAFINVHMRFKPVSFKDTEDKLYWLFLVYDIGDKMYIFRNVNEFTEYMSKQNHKVDASLIRPLTYMEMFYICAMEATKNKHATITRYPAIEMGSIYPTEVKIDTTSPSRQVQFSSQYDESDYRVYPHYPIINGTCKDSLVVHPSQVKGMGADYDKHTLS